MSPLSLEEAAALYRCFLLDTVARAVALPEVQVYLAFTPSDGEALLRALLPYPLYYIPQRGESLGEREANVFAELFQAGYSRVVLIGGDIPTLPLAHLQEAFSLLADARNDVVLGPSTDGGYYLIGAHALHPELFENITWSTPTVLTETLAQAQRAGLRVVHIPTWYDVDSAEDLTRLARELRDESAVAAAPRTREFLEVFRRTSS
jgi:rSAM/selenodomain-associated transferase 1